MDRDDACERTQVEPSVPRGVVDATDLLCNADVGGFGAGGLVVREIWFALQ